MGQGRLGGEEPRRCWPQPKVGDYLPGLAKLEALTFFSAFLQSWLFLIPFVPNMR